MKSFDPLWSQQYSLYWFSMRRLIVKVYISFGGHQTQTIERIKALYDKFKCMLIIY